MSISKLVRTEYKSGLTGAAQVAFLAVGSKLQHAQAAESGRQLWSTMSDAAFALAQGLDREAAQKAVDGLVTSIQQNASDAAVKRALDEAFGTDWSSSITTQDGKEGHTEIARRRMEALFGEKIKMDAILKKAMATVQQYAANLKNAIKLGVEFKGVGAAKLAAACKTAGDALKSDAEKAEIQRDHKIATTSSNIAGAWKKVGGPLDKDATAIVQALYGLLDLWEFVEQADRESLVRELALQAEVAKDAANAAKKSEGEPLRDIPAAPTVNELDAAVNAAQA